MRVLVVQNFQGTGLGQIADALNEAGAEIMLLHAFSGDPIPATPDGFDSLIVLGGSQDALADAVAPWLPDVCRLMRASAESGRAVLGVCLGAQLLARAFEAQNILGGATEFGWQEVALTSEGAADPIFAGVPASFRIFQWHDDTFTLPRGGVRLAGSLVAHNQAFRVGRAAYGLQFHLEADRQLVRDWNDIFAAELAERQPQWVDLHDHEASRHGPGADAAGLAIARAWVSLAQALQN